MISVKKLFILILFICIFSLFSCGKEEFYYLPQMSEGSIFNRGIDGATIIIPNISQNYAIGYRIYYRIYISSHNSPSEILSGNDRRLVHQALDNDFSFFEPITNPTNVSVLTGLTTFRNRSYYELELSGVNMHDLLARGSIPANGITFEFSFPTETTDFPVLIYNNSSEFVLRRCTRDLISPEPSNNLTFQFSPQLNTSVNADVAVSTGGSFAYVSMYIVLIGQNPENFTRMFSKPTHIGIFKLPAAN